MRGGTRIGSGRPPGARNKKTVQTQAAIEKSGLTPLEYMIGVMRNKKNDERVRLEAAHHAAPYVHARLSTTDLTVNAEQPSIVELQAKLRMYLDTNPALLSDLMDDHLESETVSEH